MDKEKQNKILVVGDGRELVPAGLLPGAHELAPPDVSSPTSSRTLVTVPDPRLEQKSKLVEKIDDYVKDVVKDLQKWLGNPVQSGKTKSLCIGMSAVQLGELIRVFVVSLQGIDWVVINPEVVKAKGKQKSHESCESIPGRTYMVDRYEVFKVRALDLDGNQRGYKGHGLLAAVLQHEFQHLDGILINRKGRMVR